MSSNNIAQSGGSDGFFGTIGTAVSESLADVIRFGAKEILPRFTIQELLDQQDDQLNNPTFIFNPGSVPNSQFGFGNQATVQNPQGTKTGLLFDNVNISVTGLILAATAVVAVVVLLRR